LRRLAGGLAALTVLAFYLGIRLAMDREARRAAAAQVEVARGARQKSRAPG
jgi:hypothetical protein